MAAPRDHTATWTFSALVSTVRRHEVSLNGYESFSQLACRQKGKLSPIPESMHTLVQPRVGVKQLPMG